MSGRTYFDDSRFMDLVVSLLVKDHQFISTVAGLLSASDFKVPKAEGQDALRFTIAELALGHFEQYREPIKDLLLAEVKAYAKRARLSNIQRLEAIKYAKRLLRKNVSAISSITEKVVQFKRERMKAAAVQRMIDMQSRGELTDEAWLQLSREAIESITGPGYHVSNYFQESRRRIDRRRAVRDNRFPFTLIEPLDARVRAIAKGHLGLVIAPYKRGKSLMLLWIAVAYILQRLNVLFITLEDPQTDVEDRFDACITNLPIKKLGRMPRTFRQRFKQFKRLVRSHLRIVDGTERRMTMAEIERIYEEERNKGFIADAVIVDYDDEIVPVKKYSERRMEFAEIYRDMRRFASTKHVLFWTAAQSKRATGGKKQLGGDDLAEDISKVRKVSFALSLGQGEWGEDSVYLWVAAHKFDKQHLGCNIMTDRMRMMIYDREKTIEAERDPERFMVETGVGELK